MHTLSPLLETHSDQLLQDDELVRPEVKLDVKRETVRGRLYIDGARLAVEEAHRFARLMKGSVNDDTVVAVLVGHVVGHEHLVAVQDSGEGKGVGGTKGQAEVGAVPRDLPIVHATEAQRLCRPHHLGDLGNLLIDLAVSIEEIPPWGSLVG